MTTPAKPKLRGVIHASMLPVALTGTIILIYLAPTWPVKVACSIYLVTSVLLFGISATYHIGHWGGQTREILRRFDHINIFLIIAGTNTPIAVATLPEFYRNFLLGIVWGGALILLLIHMFWLNAPRALLVSMYIAVGVAPILFVIPLLEYAGVLVTVMVMAGGVFYITGGIIYARKKPNLSPEWFGFHELFHTMTVLGYACHMVAIFAAVLG